MKTVIKFLAISAIAVASIASCEKYDDSWIKSSVSSLESRVSTLESSMKQLSDYQSIKDKINSGKYISGYKQNADGSYTITFSDNSTITIKDGANGAKGDQGLQGEKGDKGNPGATPSFKIEKETWYVSYDDGASWKEIGSAIDRSLFSGVAVEDECVKLTLADGSVVAIPIGEKKVIGMEIDESDIVFAADPEAYLSNKMVVPFTLSGDLQSPRIYCNAQVSQSDRGQVFAKVEMNEDGKSGNVVITRQRYYDTQYWDYVCDYYPDAKISLVTFNGDGQSCLKEINVIGELTQYNYLWFGDSYDYNGLSDYSKEIFYSDHTACKGVPLIKQIFIDLGDSGLKEEDLCINLDFLNKNYPLRVSSDTKPVQTDVEYDAMYYPNQGRPYVAYTVSYYYDIPENTTSKNVKTEFLYCQMLTSSRYQKLSAVTLIQCPKEAK